MTSKVGICNKALGKLGEKTITALLDDSDQARACNREYDGILREMLRAHPWNFAITRSELASDVASPEWGFDVQFQIPSDCVRILNIDIENIEYRIEGRKILSHSSEPLRIRYVKLEEDPNQYDPLFVDAFATRLAIELTENLTQSNTKKASLLQDFDASMRQAKRVDGQEEPFKRYAEDDWITIRF